MQINWWVPVCLIETSRSWPSHHNSFCIGSSSQLAAAGHQHQAVVKHGVKQSVISLDLCSSFFYNLNMMVSNSISTNWWMRLACIKPRQWFLVIEIVGCSHLEALEMGIRAGNEPSRSLNFYNLVEGPSPGWRRLLPLSHIIKNWSFLC